MGEVDVTFIQDQELRPNLQPIEAEGIPLIDLSILQNQPTIDELKPLIKEIGDACKEWRFFQVINHGVPLEKKEKVENASKKFFALPLEEKRKVRRDEEKVLVIMIWNTLKMLETGRQCLISLVKHQPSFLLTNLMIKRSLCGNQWPDYPPKLRVAYEEYAVEMEKLAYKLMELIVMSLGLEPKRFHKFFKDQTS